MIFTSFDLIEYLCEALEFLELDFLVFSSSSDHSKIMLDFYDPISKARSPPTEARFLDIMLSYGFGSLSNHVGSMILSLKECIEGRFHQTSSLVALIKSGKSYGGSSI